MEIPRAPSPTGTLERLPYMNPYVKEFEDRLRGMFEKKAEEFSRFAEEQPRTAMVASQLADLYRDLAQIMRQ